MRRYQGLLSWSVLLASLGGAQAKLDLNSTSNIVVYWGQNSFNGKGDKEQQPLAHYCDNDDIDVIPMAFNMMVNGPGGAPAIDFSVTSKDCGVFEGTDLKNCPSIGKDIKKCQEKGKTILLSIGGATYSEGGFKSEEAAKEGAKLMWETFGPKQEDSKALRPFGDSALDGFDFDFEANVQHMAPFANEMRSLMEADKSKQKFYLTAAPQCPYPDQADKDILNGPVYIDAIWVQFYNNFCGVNNFNTDASSSKYNFEEWDNWAKTVSKNKDVKVIIGVPAFTSAASTGYIPASKLAEVIEYTEKFESFGGVMMWDATQAYANDGFIKDVRKALGPANDSGSSSPDPVSTSASTSTSTDSTTTTKSSTTSSSSSAPDSSHSSSSFSSASASHKEPEESTSEGQNPVATATSKPTTITTATAKPDASTTTPPVSTSTSTSTSTDSTTTTKSSTTSSSSSAPKSSHWSSSSSASTSHKAPEETTSKEQKPVVPDATPNPTTVATATTKPDTSTTPSAETTAAPTSNASPPNENHSSDDESNDESENNILTSVLGNDLLGLLGGLSKANKVASRATYGLTNNLRHAQRNRT